MQGRSALTTYGLAHIVDDPSPLFPTLAVSRAGEVVGPCKKGKPLPP